jgi:hypothetical protein
MAMRIEPNPNKKTLNSGKIPAKAREKDPPPIENRPIMTTSIATIVTVRGRFLNDLLSVLYQVLLVSVNITWFGELIL